MNKKQLISSMVNLKFFSNNLESALLALNKDEAMHVFMDAASVGTPIEIAGELVAETLKRIGDKWGKGKLSLSQVYMSGVICEQLLDQILPPTNPTRKNQPRMAIAVFEDYHVLGKRIVYSALRASGFELMDLGAGLDTQKLLDIIKKEKIKILLLSVLMLPSALHIKDLKINLKGIGVKIVVGGAPFRMDEQLWMEVGADSFGRDSSEAIQIVTKNDGGRYESY